MKGVCENSTSTRGSMESRVTIGRVFFSGRVQQIFGAQGIGDSFRSSRAQEMTKDGERMISSLGLLQSVRRHEERNVNTETEERSSIQHSFITILTRQHPKNKGRQGPMATNLPIVGRRKLQSYAQALRPTVKGDPTHRPLSSSFLGIMCLIGITL